MLVGRGGVLIRSGGPFLGGADTALRPFIDLFHLIAGILDLLAVLSGLLTHLIHLGLNGSGGVAHILFGSATGGDQRSRHDACSRKETFHIPNLALHNAIQQPMSRAAIFPIYRGRVERQPCNDYARVCVFFLPQADSDLRAEMGFYS